MRFLIKAAFWLGLVVILLPVPDAERGGASTRVSATDAIAFLGSAVSYIKGFCARNPDSCETGTVAVHQFGEKAQYGAKILHEFIAAKMKDSKDLVPPKGSRAPQQANAPDSGKSPGKVNGTLKAEDRLPQWQGGQAGPAARG